MDVAADELPADVKPKSEQTLEKALSGEGVNTLAYQEIVDRLHRLANEPDELDNDGTLSPNVCKTLNGLSLKTPSNTPEANQTSTNTDTDNKLDQIVISRNEFGVSYIRYQSEHQMPDIMSLISKDLSEPYSIYTYRYFIHNWPHLCFLAMDKANTVGAIVCKIDPHKRTMRQRGYIAMLAVDHNQRRKKIGSKLVSIAIEAMINCQADEVVLETEVTNIAALNLYEKLGFVRDKRLYKYYLNGVDAFRLKLWIT